MGDEVENLSTIEKDYKKDRESASDVGDRDDAVLREAEENQKP
jgi:hypothetical protein